MQDSDALSVGDHANRVSALGFASLLDPSSAPTHASKCPCIISVEFHEPELKKLTHLKKARKHFKLASKQADGAAVHAWEPSEPAQCVGLTFYAYENGVVAAAEAACLTWKRTHPSKVEVARELFSQKKLKTNIADRLEYFNRLRKDVSYGEPGEDLTEVDLEDVVSDLYEFLAEVEEFVSSLEDEE